MTTGSVDKEQHKTSPASNTSDLGYFQTRYQYLMFYILDSRLRAF